MFSGRYLATCDSVGMILVFELAAGAKMSRGVGQREVDYETWKIMATIKCPDCKCIECFAQCVSVRLNIYEPGLSTKT